MKEKQTKKEKTQREVNYIVKGMYDELIAKYEYKIGMITEYNTTISTRMIKTLKNRYLELRIKGIV